MNATEMSSRKSRTLNKCQWKIKLTIAKTIDADISQRTTVNKLSK